MLQYTTGRRGSMVRREASGLKEIEEHLVNDETVAWLTLDGVFDVRIEAVFYDDVDGDPDPAPFYEIRCEKGYLVSNAASIEGAIELRRGLASLAKSAEGR